MTLCIAWIRQEKEKQEMIFVTDSCLSGGQRWESGVKLFELPRKDCIICFSGSTDRTYPLILSLINSLKYDKHASNSNYDLTDLVFYLCSQFSEIIKLTDLNFNDLEKDIKDFPFDFLFGGWSWKENEFKLWKILYSFDVHEFIPSTDYDNLVFSMIGDDLEIARKMLEDEIKNSGKILSGNLDMEPLKVLVKIIRDPKYNTISGAVQIAKIYPPGQVEFFGMYYPSAVNGKKTFLGRDVSKTNNPAVRFIDPDTGSINELEVPDCIEGVDLDNYGIDKEFIISCYNDKNRLKDNLSEREKELLKAILKENAYKQFLANLPVTEDKMEELYE